jgi:uncharacterized protein YndB with AHSA1/START domain
MKPAEKVRITIENRIQAPVEWVWKCFTEPEHIIHWNNASDDWHTPKAMNDLKPGGRFCYTMAARDGSVQFDFEGTYSEVRQHEVIEYILDDGRKVQVRFTAENSQVHVVETFEAETMHPPEMQREGWQAILNNFKAYVLQKWEVQNVK